MKQFYSLLLFSISFATIITVDDDGLADYSTIQAAIDISVDGDTVLVHRGFYQENLFIDKSITLASHAIFDNLGNLDSWTEYDDQFFFEWQVNNDNINETIIDGSIGSSATILGEEPNDAITVDFGSSIFIYNGLSGCINPSIIGFTIQNGAGTQVQRDGENLYLGGGVLTSGANPLINYNKIINNGDAEVFSGGGAYMGSEPEDFGFDNRYISRSRCDVQEYDISNNFYNNNDAQYGNTFANRYFEESFDMSESIFDVANCQAEEISPVWVYVEPEAETDLEGSAADACAIAASDVYINPNQDQECLYDGCGYENSPFKTITFALQYIVPSESNPVTLHLSDGEYSPSTGEEFPLILPSYVTLAGQSQNGTIIDAQNSGRIIQISSSNNTISDLTLRNGSLLGCTWYCDDKGAGIYAQNSNLLLSNLNIENNYAENGAGIYLYNVEGSLNFLNINENEGMRGAGIYLLNSSPQISNCVVSNNSSKFPEYELPYNFNYTYSGIGIFMDNSSPILDSVDVHGNEIYFQNLTLHAYSEEESLGAGVSITNQSSPQISNMAVYNNTGNSSNTNFTIEYNNDLIIPRPVWDGDPIYASKGGGLYIFNSSPQFENMEVYNNYAPFGGGVFSDGFDVSLTNLNIYNNYAQIGGGVYVSGSGVFENTVIRNNESVLPGSGLACAPNIDNDGCSIIFSDSLRSSIYSNGYIARERGSGLDIFSNGNILDVVVDTFTVINPTDFHAFPIEDFIFDINSSIHSQVESDLFVSPMGDDEANDGLTYDTPLKTIYKAANMILSDSLNARTIYLDEGIYSPSSNGEVFPVQVPDYITIKGYSINETILDAEQTSNVISLNFNDQINIRDLTIRGGYSDKGAGIFSGNSSLDIDNVIITENSFKTDSEDLQYGIGIYNENSIIGIDSVSIINNNGFSNEGFLMGLGGGIYSNGNGQVSLSHSTIAYNSAFSGSAVYNESDFHDYYDDYIETVFLDSINRCNIYNNFAAIGEIGGVRKVVLDTFTVAQPSFILTGFGEVDFDINVGINQQVTGDLYISHFDGSDDNLGTSPDAPLKTLQRALITHIVDFDNPSTFHLNNGLYEVFSPMLLFNTNVIGESRDSTIIDFSKLVKPRDFNTNMPSMFFHPGFSGYDILDPVNINISNFTMQNGIGCLSINDVEFLAESLLIQNNDGGGCVNGGGISIEDSQGTLSNSVIRDNTAAEGGGGIYIMRSDVIIDRSLIYENQIAWNQGWGEESSYINNSTGIWNRGGRTSIFNSIVSDNGISHNEHWYYSESEYLNIVNSIIYHGSSLNEDFLGANITVNYSNVEWEESGNWSGSNNIFSDPLFIDWENGDFNLDDNSPNIDAGTIDVDFDGFVDIIDFNGESPDIGVFEFDSGLLSNDQLMPKKYNLYNPYPNPFNPSTMISFSIPEYSHVSIQIFDLNGRLVSNVANQYYVPGHHQINWSGEKFSSGLYLVKMVSEKFTDTQKIMLIK